MSVDSSASSTAGTVHLKCLIKPPAKPVVLDLMLVLDKNVAHILYVSNIFGAQIINKKRR